VRLADASARDIVGPSCVETEGSIWTTADDAAVVVVLTIVLPTAFRTDFVLPSFVEGSVTATRACVLPAWRRCEDIALLDIEVEPSLPSGQKFLVAHARIVILLPRA